MTEANDDAERSAACSGSTGWSAEPPSSAGKYLYRDGLTVSVVDVHWWKDLQMGEPGDWFAKLVASRSPFMHVTISPVVRVRHLPGQWIKLPDDDAVAVERLAGLWAASSKEEAMRPIFKKADQ